jgi:hypothetical protein
MQLKSKMIRCDRLLQSTLGETEPTGCQINKLVARQPGMLQCCKGGEKLQLARSLALPDRKQQDWDKILDSKHLGRFTISEGIVVP